MNEGCRAETCCGEAPAGGYDAGTGDPSTPEDSILFANIGDYGELEGGVGKEGVFDLVASWNPEYITTNGDNWYSATTGQANWELYAVSRYKDWIFPYSSVLGRTSSAVFNNFYACTGNHDRDPVGHKLSFGWFNYPEVYRLGAWQASTGYYEVRRGFVHHFFYDAGYDNQQYNQQADGNDLLSIQAVWLQTQLAASNATWKIVHIHHPGYTSTLTSLEGEGPAGTLVGDGYLAYTAMRNITNMLQEWGADVALYGHVHNYERLSLDGFPIICNGTGGANGLVGFGTPIPESVVRVSSTYGAIKGTATCHELTLEWFGVDGVRQDILTLTK